MDSGKWLRMQLRKFEQKWFKFSVSQVLTACFLAFWTSAHFHMICKLFHLLQDSLTLLESYCSHCFLLGSAIHKCLHGSMHLKLMDLMSFTFKFCSEYDSLTRVSVEIQLHEFMLGSSNILGIVCCCTDSNVCHSDWSLEISAKAHNFRQDQQIQWNP